MENRLYELHTVVEQITSKLGSLKQQLLYYLIPFWRIKNTEQLSWWFSFRLLWVTIKLLVGAAAI